MIRIYVISTFEHSLYLELAVTELQLKGIAKDKILAVPLKKRIEERKILDTIHYSDGISLFDGAAIMGTLFMVLGTIYGFVLKWGPVIWAVIGLAAGALLGFILDFLIKKNHKKKEGGKGNTCKTEGKSTEVVLIINCSKDQSVMVQKTLWDHFALGVAELYGKGGTV